MNGGLCQNSWSSCQNYELKIHYQAHLLPSLRWQAMRIISSVSDQASLLMSGRS
jgi:hypothetical protein